jgi:hypothetical protein
MRFIVSVLLISVLGLAAFAAQKDTLIAKQNGKNKLGTGYYFTYNFAQKPSIGTNILKIQIFDNKGNKNSSFGLKGTSDMAEMRGMGSDEQAFKKNKKNDYLLPVDASMRGDWVVAVKFLLKKAEYARYTIKFNI